MKSLAELTYDAGMMPILFANETCYIPSIISALEQTEIPAVEILQRGNGAKEALKEAVRFRKTAYVGAGTVCSLDQGKEMVDLGADFLVSPGFNPELVEWCVKNDVLIIPGVSSVTEIMMAQNAGLKLLKVFPFNELGGESFVNAISGPFSDVKFVITGSLDERDLHHVSNKKIAAIGGVWMFQSEEDKTVISEEKIIHRINTSLSIAKLYRNGWQ